MYNASIEIQFDPRDWSGMLKLMRLYGQGKMPFSGKNEEGEDVRISIYPDRIITSTSQNNGWTRINVYHEDYTVEELYEK